MLTAALVAALLHVHLCDASYSCCSEERRGTVCTLAGSGASASIDIQNPTAAAFNGPVGVALYPPDRIIVGGYAENRLRVIHHNGTVSTLAGGGSDGSLYVDSDNPLAARFNNPAGVCVDSEGNVLLCDQYNHRVRTILRNGSVRTLAGNGGAGYGDKVDPLKAEFDFPQGIASITENGQHLIIIGGNYDQRVRVIYPNKTVSTLAGSGPIGYLNCASQDNAYPLAARFCHPVGTAQDRFGNIIVAEWAAGRLRKVWRDGSQSGVTTVAGSGPIGLNGGSSIDSDNPATASFFTPLRVAVDGANSILFSTIFEHRFRIIFVNGSVRTLAGSGPSSGLSQSTLGAFTDNVALRQARFNTLQYFVIDREGNVILADRGNNRVRMLCAGLPVATPNSFSSSSTFTESSSATITLESPSQTVSPVPSHSLPSVSWTGHIASISISISASVNPAATHTTISAASSSTSLSPSQSLRLESSPLEPHLPPGVIGGGCSGRGRFGSCCCRSGWDHCHDVDGSRDSHGRPDAERRVCVCSGRTGSAVGR